MLRALIFDVDGTLADTESAHLAAFNQAFAQIGLGWNWDERLYTKLLDISGGKERMLHYWHTTPSAQREVDALAVRDTVERLHRLKTAAYETAVGSGAVGLRAGVLDLVEDALAHDLRLAIATTTTPVNIAALLRRAMGSHWRSNFEAIGDASNAPLKKPHPQVYLNTLATLRLRPGECLAFEDSRNGLLSATAAGLATIVTPTHFTAQHDFGAALRVLPDLGGVAVAQLRIWHRETAGALDCPSRSDPASTIEPLPRELPCPCPTAPH